MTQMKVVQRSACPTAPPLQDSNRAISHSVLLRIAHELSERHSMYSHVALRTLDLFWLERVRERTNASRNTRDSIPAALLVPTNGCYFRLHASASR
jgi:hypothetical protein